MNLTAIRTDARYLVSPQLTSTNFADPDCDRFANHWYRMAVIWILEAMGWNWEYQGEFATTNLVDDQQEYVLPTTLLRLTRVEVKYSSTSQYAKALPIDDKNIVDGLGNTSFSVGTEGAPGFRLSDNSLFLHPIPTANVTNGLRIEFVDDITELSSGSDSPNLPSVLSRILSVGAAHDYALSKEMYRKREELERIIYGKPGVTGTGLKYQLETIFSRREDTTKKQIRVKRENYN